MKNLHIVRIALALMLVGCAPAQPNPTLCELRKNTEAYAGRTVTVDGVLLGSRHGSLVVDLECGGGVGLSWSREDVPGRPEFDSIADRVQYEKMIATVRVTGTVQREAHGRWGLPPGWILELTRAEVLEARPVSERDYEQVRDWLSEGQDGEPFRPML